MLHAAVGEAEAEVAVGSVDRRSTDPKRLRWWDGRRWTDNYAPREPTGTEPALRSTALPAQPSETSRDVEVGDAYAARVPDVGDEDPSDILRRVQAGMSAARLSVPLDEQIEIVGEQFCPKEIRKLFRECGMPITAAGCTLESEMCFLVPEPGTRMTPTPSRSWCEHSMWGICLPPWPGATTATSSPTPSDASS